MLRPSLRVRGLFKHLLSTHLGASTTRLAACAYDQLSKRVIAHQLFDLSVPSPASEACDLITWAKSRCSTKD
ncbi:MAG: hypothetical protein AB4426_03815 [Xenococcaceae cyanobacterium]